MTESNGASICQRCKVNRVDLVARNESMCNGCFVKYVNTKVIKRLEGFSTRHAFAGAQKQLLIPVSFGPASTALLHMLDRQIQWQNSRSGRSGFILHVVHVHENKPEQRAIVSQQFELLKSHYPNHSYESILSASIYDQPAASSSMAHATDSPSKCSTDKLDQLYRSIKEISSRGDLDGILLRRLVVRHAQDHNMDGILWGDSTTRLAEKVLSESAKGRGYSLPWSVSDGETPFGVAFHFPLRDVLKKEVLQYIKHTDPPLIDLLAADQSSEARVPISSRSMTIDLLSRQYFDSVEANYPSIVSNVVRTSTKLEPSNISLQRCKLCCFPVTAEQLAHSNWQGLQRARSLPDPFDLGLCYGCSRTIEPDVVPLLP